MAGPIIEAARARFRENRPIVAAVVEGLRNAAGNPNNALTPADVPVVAAAVQDAIARDPVVQNAMNAEPATQSRVVTGTVPAVVASLSTFFMGLSVLLGALGPTLALTGPAKWLGIVVTLSGGVGSTGGIFALFGRLASGLPPMTRRLWNPFSWFAPRPGS